MPLSRSYAYPGEITDFCWPPCLDLVEHTHELSLLTFSNIYFIRIKSRKTKKSIPATEKLNAHLKLQLLKVFLEHNSQMLHSFLLCSVWWRHENTFSVVTASVTEAVSEKTYFKKHPKTFLLRDYGFQMETLLLKEYLSFKPYRLDFSRYRHAWILLEF